MAYEVEQKFRDLPAGFGSRLSEALEASQSELGPTHSDLNNAKDIVQVDVYYAHPQRDFAVTDEALRIRTSGEHTVVTYKGPRIDDGMKTRLELELEFLPVANVRDQASQLLAALGFEPVAELRKRRRVYSIDRNGWQIAVSLDEVETLGEFVELEIVAEENQLDSARQVLDDLAQELGLQHIERKSYLELFLDRDNG